MSKAQLIVVAIVMWFAPAFLALMLGWPGIWGGGSAFSDLLIPAPITGGAFHIPSFVLALALIRASANNSDGFAAVLRCGFFAAFLLGLAMLVNLERLYFALLTDMEASALRLHRNYVGLCLTTDAGIAFLWSLAHRRGSVSPLLTAIITMTPVLVYVAYSLSTSSRIGAQFLIGKAEPQRQRGDEILWVYTPSKVRDTEFEQAALAFVDPHHPNQNVNVQDLAVYFSNSLHDAREFSPDAKPQFSVCLYEDGSATIWHDGAADCFGAHENFSEKLAAVFDTADESLPQDVRNYWVAQSMCRDVQVPDSLNLEIEEHSFCRYARLDEKYAELLERHGEQQLNEMLGNK